MLVSAGDIKVRRRAGELSEFKLMYFYFVEFLKLNIFKPRVIETTVRGGLTYYNFPENTNFVI